MTQPPEPYNPLDRVELGRSVERALLARPLVPLGSVGRFAGAGLYVIYYSGPFSLYQPITPPACALGEVPIYAGRARPRGARQGIESGLLSGATFEPVLSDRLRDHANSIRAVESYEGGGHEPNLRLRDFACRYLIVDEIWVALGEALLIGHYRPVWNVVVDGFGNHAPGKGRNRQARSPWDELHPGRSWAFSLPPPRLTQPVVETRVRTHLQYATTADLAAQLLTHPSIAVAGEDDGQ